MNKLNVIIIDDEEPARKVLRSLLTNFFQEITIVGEAHSLQVAIELIKRNKPDLVFLDIEMPKQSGLLLRKELGEAIDFEIIVTTAYPSYALQAFEIAAIDYLLKPIDIRKLEASLKRISIKREKLPKLTINEKGKTLYVDYNQIVCLVADGSYTKIFKKDKTVIVSSKNLSYYESIIDSRSFYRCHRSYLVNIDSVLMYKKNIGELVLIDETIVKISRSNRRFFEQMFQ